MGRIAGLYGVRGWLKVRSFTEPREAILDYDGWQLHRDGQWQPVEVAEGRRHGKTVVMRLNGIEDRDRAAEWLNADIAVPREALPATRTGQYYWSDLEGLEVVRQDGQVLGTVAYLIETGANDVLVVQGEEERLIPFVREQVILDVDLANGVIRVDWEFD